jgi:hypothetical protein
LIHPLLDRAERMLDVFVQRFREQQGLRSVVTGDVRHTEDYTALINTFSDLPRLLAAGAVMCRSAPGPG